MLHRGVKNSLMQATALRLSCMGPMAGSDHSAASGAHPSGRRPHPRPHGPAVHPALAAPPVLPQVSAVLSDVVHEGERCSATAVPCRLHVMLSFMMQPMHSNNFGQTEAK